MVCARSLTTEPHSPYDIGDFNTRLYPCHKAHRCRQLWNVRAFVSPVTGSLADHNVATVYRHHVHQASRHQGAAVSLAETWSDTRDSLGHSVQRFRLLIEVACVSCAGSLPTPTIMAPRLAQYVELMRCNSSLSITGVVRFSTHGEDTAIGLCL